MKNNVSKRKKKNMFGGAKKYIDKTMNFIKKYSHLSVRGKLFGRVGGKLNELMSKI